MLLNEIKIAGRLGKDPELNYSTSGLAYARLSLAVYQGRNKDTMWIPVVCWEGVAERVAQTIEKGAEVIVEGYLQCRSFTDKATKREVRIFEISAKKVDEVHNLKDMKTKEDVVVYEDIDFDHPF